MLTKINNWWTDDLDDYYYNEDKDEDYPDDGPGVYTDDEDDDYEYESKSNDEENEQDDVTQPQAPEMGAEQGDDYDEVEAKPDDDHEEGEAESADDQEPKEETGDTMEKDQPDNAVLLHGNDNIPPGNTGVDSIGDPIETTGVEQAVTKGDNDSGPQMRTPLN